MILKKKKKKRSNDNQRQGAGSLVQSPHLVFGWGLRGGGGREAGLKVLSLLSSFFYFFNSRRGWYPLGWRNPRQSRPRSRSCGCVRRCACCGKSCGRPPSWSVPASWPPACSGTPQRGSASGRTGRRWSPGRSRRTRWGARRGRPCSRLSAPPGRCPWLPRPRCGRPGGGGAPGRAVFPTGRWYLALGLGHGAPPAPSPPTLCSPTGTGSPRWSPCPGSSPGWRERTKNKQTGLWGETLTSWQHEGTWELLLCQMKIRFLSVFDLIKKILDWYWPQFPINRENTVKTCQHCRKPL